jgi:hypothetical protein
MIRIVILLAMLLCLSACVPTSGVFNYPSGVDGKATSMSGTTPPFSFSHSLDDGDYFITTNPSANSIVINIRLTKKIAVKFQSGVVKLSKDGTTYKSYAFEEISLSQPLKFDCTSTKLTGCNHIYRYAAELKLGDSSEIDIPQIEGDKIWVLPPSIIYNEKLIEIEEVMFERKDISWMTPLL